LKGSKGRKARLHGSPREGLECGRKLSFHCEREIAFTARRVANIPTSGRTRRKPRFPLSRRRVRAVARVWTCGHPRLPFELPSFTPFSVRSSSACASAISGISAVGEKPSRARVRIARASGSCRCAGRRVAWPERGRGRPVRNPRRKARSAAASTAALKVAEHLAANGTVLTVYTREAIAERKAMRALIRSFREDARAALSELGARAPDRREEVPEAHGSAPSLEPDERWTTRSGSSRKGVELP
jgi:hypothetical protein